mmetsp:Transcript_23229/g.72589  ORF Transcript_23229/g.72589 Transcript_23229/m.72589 type:complete len:446 (-) Transcript_23229:442-1779(-)
MPRRHLLLCALDLASHHVCSRVETLALLVDRHQAAALHHVHLHDVRVGHHHDLNEHAAALGVLQALLVVEVDPHALLHAGRAQGQARAPHEVIARELVVVVYLDVDLLAHVHGGEVEHGVPLGVDVLAPPLGAHQLRPVLDHAVRVGGRPVLRVLRGLRVRVLVRPGQDVRLLHGAAGAPGDHADPLGAVEEVAQLLPEPEVGRDLPIGAKAPLLVEAVGEHHQEGELEEGEERLPPVDDALGGEIEDDEQPHVCPHGEEGRAQEHAHVGDAAYLTRRWCYDADRRDHQQVERRRAHDRRGPQLVRGIPEGGHHPQDGEEDLGGRGAQCHESEVGNRLVPHHHFDHLLLARHGVGDSLLHLLAGDLLDGVHEHVGHDGNAEEAVQQREEVDPAAHGLVPHLRPWNRDVAFALDMARVGVATTEDAHHVARFHLRLHGEERGGRPP